MDEIVRRALQRWPDVPDVYGWLRLDRRGNWLVRTRQGAFERIGNAAFNAFISRNYQPDARGRWFFQNGPQRVFVGLDCAPWVFRLDDGGRDWLGHTGAPAGAVRQLLFDAEGGALLATALGIGSVLDRDLGALLDSLQDELGQPVDGDALLAGLRAGQAQRVKLGGVPVTVERIAAAGLAGRYGFDPEPGPETRTNPQDGQT